MDADRSNIALRKFLKLAGITARLEIERGVFEGKIEGTQLIPSLVDNDLSAVPASWPVLGFNPRLSGTSLLE